MLPYTLWYLSHLYAKTSGSFAEMPTSSFVESGFWCFDALFVPQQHPAREVQDTFYLSGKRSVWTTDGSTELVVRSVNVSTSPRFLLLPRI